MIYFLCYIIILFNTQIFQGSVHLCSEVKKKRASYESIRPRPNYLKITEFVFHCVVMNWELLENLNN